MNRRHFFSLLSLLGLFRFPAESRAETPRSRPASVILQRSPVRGFHHHQPCELPGDLRAGDILELRAEPANPHDRKAVAIFHRGRQLGYLPREDNAHASRLLAQGVPLPGTIIAVAPERYEWDPLEIEIAIPRFRPSYPGPAHE